MSRCAPPSKASASGATACPTGPPRARSCATARCPTDAPARPSPQLLAPNERRRAPDTVAVALEVALAACTAAGRDPRTLPSVFASTHGDLAITDYMCATLAERPALDLADALPQFGAQRRRRLLDDRRRLHAKPTTAISAYDATLRPGPARSAGAIGAPARKRCCWSATTAPPRAACRRSANSAGLLGGALVLSRAPTADAPRIASRRWRRATHRRPTRRACPASPAAMRWRRCCRCSKRWPTRAATCACCSPGRGRALRVEIAMADVHRPRRAATSRW